jgi:Ca-activated chloride channel homolog
MVEFRLAHPYAVLLLVPMASLLAYWWFDFRHSSTQIAFGYTQTRIAERIPGSLRIRLRRFPYLLHLCGWLLLVAALTRPQWGNVETIIQQEGISITLALDISSSMAELQDGQQRLGIARDVLRSFVAERAGDEIGLVVFANEAYIVSPLTLDHETLSARVAGIELATSLGLPDGTSIGQGVVQALSMLDSTDTSSKVIILLTDGINNVQPGGTSIDPGLAAELAAALGVRIYAIGFLPSDPYSGESGQVLLPTEIAQQRDTLTDLGTTTQGGVFEVADQASLAAVYRAIDELEKSPVERREFVQWQDTGDGLSILALSLLLVAAILRYSVFQVLP